MSTYSEPAAENVIPTFDVRALARRAAIPAALAALVVAVLIVAGGPVHAFADALRRAVDADPRWVAGAAVLELLSFAGYVMLLWLIGSRATDRLGLRQSAEVTLGGAAATRLLPTAGVGGAALTLWALRRTGMGSRRATQTLMTFLITLYSVFLTAIIAAGLTLATGIAHGSGPTAVDLVPAVGAAVVLFGHLALAAWGPRGETHGRIAGVAGLLGGAVREGLALVRSLDPRLLGAIAWWIFDGAVLWAMLHAFGAPPPFMVVVLAYFVGQVGNTIPIPGAVSGGMVGILVAFNVPADLALVSVFAYRAVAIWLPAPLGLVALGSLRRTIARWGAEDRLVEPARVEAAPEPVVLARRPSNELQLAA